MSSRVLTPANQITILRLVFVPVFAILVIDRHYGWALGVLVLAAVSDIADGTVARIFHQQSPLGMALDPIADKILMTTAYLVLAWRDALPTWLMVLVISRDVAIVTTAALISLVAGYRPFTPSILGKVSTVTQIITIFLAVAHQAGIPLASGGLLYLFIYLTAGFTLGSGMHYLIVIRNRYGRPESGAKPTPPPTAGA